jgi:phosphoglucosamine mutase
MSARLFGTDGIRGVAGKWPLTADFVRRIGRAAGRTLAGSGRRIFLVRDTRASGPGLARALSAGLAAEGLAVADGGVLPTPSVAALNPRRGFAAGAVISASHNPAEFNGIKFFGPMGEKLPDALELEIEKRLADGREDAPAGRGGASPFRGAAEEYLRFLRSTAPSGLDLRGFRMGVDCANGATSALAARLFRSFGAEVTALSASPDGRNINRGCGALHPARLARLVRARGLHFGAAFDGDGDRAILVDERGQVRDGDSVLLVAARHLKARGRLKKDLVVVTVMTNLGLYRALEALGLRTVETPVGDRYVWQAMRETGAVLGGEPSGHVIFREFLTTGDGMLTALQVASMMRAAGRPLSALAGLYLRLPQVLVNVRVREKRPLESVKGVRADMARLKSELGKNGRLVVRYSGTEPLLRIMIEGPDQKAIEAQARALADSVKRAGLAA